MAGVAEERRGHAPSNRHPYSNLDNERASLMARCKREHFKPVALVAVDQFGRYAWRGFGAAE